MLLGAMADIFEEVYKTLSFISIFYMREEFCRYLSKPLKIVFIARAN